MIDSQLAGRRDSVCKRKKRDVSKTNKAIASLMVLSSMSICSAQQSELTAHTARMEAPRIIRYSGVLTFPSGQPMSGGHSLTFSIYDSAEAGRLLWSEKQDVKYR
jgi:hypothetical protein